MKSHKLLLLFSLTLLLVQNIFGQAAVDISLVASANNYNFPLSVGLDLTATICIDPQLGESDLPSPPPGVTEIRFDLFPYGCNASTYKDYRAPGNPPAFPFTGMIQHLLWWNTNGAPIDITYYLPSGAVMYITDQIGGSLLNIGPFNGQGIATIPGSYTSIFARAYLRMEYDNIIPVELTSFTASVLQDEKVVLLNWQTATEMNNSGFEVERLQDSKIERLKDWETVGFVPGFGTTTEPKSYSFIDENVSSGSYKYRLKQIDFDGTFEYSNEIEVEVDFAPKQFVLYQNYPNPFNSSTIINYELPKDERVRINLFNILGEQILTLFEGEQKAGEHQISLSSVELPSGNYFYSLETTSIRQIKKLTIIK